MARIRTIKPEFPQSESMGRVSRDARLLFIMLWTIADDFGRARASSRMLASLLFPYDDDAVLKIPEWLMELERQNCVKVYAVDGNAYLQVLKWSDHQKVDNPSKSRFPEMPTLAKRSTRLARKPEKVATASDEISLDQGPRTKEGTKDLSVTNVTAAPAAGEVSPEEKPEWWPRRDRYGRVLGEMTDKIVFDLGKAVLGQNAGGQISKLKRCYHGDLRACADIMLQAEEKSDSREWFAGVLKRAERDEPLVPQHEKFPENIYREHA